MQEFGIREKSIIPCSKKGIQWSKLAGTVDIGDSHFRGYGEWVCDA